MDGDVGVIVDYKYLDGPSAGKIYKRRFETVGAFVSWNAECGIPGLVKILNTKIVAPEMVYWDDRWTAEKA